MNLYRKAISNFNLIFLEQFSKEDASQHFDVTSRHPRQHYDKIQYTYVDVEKYMIHTIDIMA